MLDINILRDTICKYFLSFSGLTFNFVDDFLCCALLFSLIQSHLRIFAFVAFCHQMQRIISKMCQRQFMFSSQSFMALDFLSKSWIHFEVIFMCG